MSQQTPKNRVLFVRRFTPVVLVLFGVLSLLTLGLRSPEPAQAATTSSTINFQARLETSTGAIAADGNYNVEFKLYGGSSCAPATGSGCTALWTEDYLNSASQGVRVANGYLSVSLGSITAFPATINWDQPLYISMNIGGTTTGAVTWDGAMLPYLQLTAVPYAFRAGQLATTNTAGTYVSTLGIQAPTGGNQTFQLQDQGAAGTYNLLTMNASTGISTLGTASALTGKLAFANSGSAYTITLTTAAETVGNATITIPNTAGANDTVCLQTLANCTGVSGGSVGGSGTASTIAMFTGSGYTIGNSIMSQTGTTIGVAGTLQATTLNANAVQTNGSTRIDSSGNLTNINNATVSGQLAVSNGTTSMPFVVGGNGTVYQGVFANGSEQSDTLVTGFMNNELTNADTRGATVSTAVTGGASITSPNNLVRPGTGDRTSNVSLTAAGTAQWAITGLNIQAPSRGVWTPYLVLRAGQTPAAVKVELRRNDNTTWDVIVNDTAPVFAGGVWVGPEQVYSYFPITGYRITLTYNGTATSYIREIGLQNRNTEFGANTFAILNESNVFRPNSDATNIFQIQNSTGSSIFDADSNNRRISINTATPAYTLDVGGDVNTSGVYRINGTTICSSSGCTPTAGSGSYVQLQGTTPGTAQNGNFNIIGTGVIGTLNVGAGGITLNNSGAANDATSYNMLINSGSDPTLGSLQLTFGTHPSATGANRYGFISSGDTQAMRYLILNTNGVGAFGNVGIGNTTPAALLGVGSSSQFQVDGSGNVSTTGTAKVQTTTNTSTAFQIQNASGVNVLNADTANSQITLGSGVVNESLAVPTGLSVVAGSNQSGSLLAMPNNPSLSQATTYYYKVSAVSANGETLASSETSIGTSGTTNFTPLVPPGAPSLAPTSGSTLGVGTYKYQVTYITNFGGFYSGSTTGGTEVSVTTTSGNQAVALTNIPIGPAGTTARSIFRTAVNGASGSEKLVATIYNNTATTYTDTTTDGSLNSSIPTTNTAFTPTNSAVISWSAVPGAVSYRVYRGTAAGSENIYFTTATTTLTDNGSGGAAGATMTPQGVMLGSATLVRNINQNSVNAFQVQNAGGVNVMNVDTTKSLVNFQSSTDGSILGAELVTVPDFTNAAWTSTGWTTTATSATHTIGNTNYLSTNQISVVPGATYQITYTVSGNPATYQGVTASIGGNSNEVNYVFGNATETTVVTAANNGPLEFYPTSGWNGTISNVSVKLVTSANPTIQISGTTGTAVSQIRVGSDTSSNFNNSSSIYVGLNSGSNSQAASCNSALGTQSLQFNTTGQCNAAVGAWALQYNASGEYNAALGESALWANTSGSNNAAVGEDAMYNNMTGNYNTAVGQGSLVANIGGSYNTAVGNYALMTANGSNNTAVGSNAGGGLVNNASDNTLLGYNAGYNDALGKFSTSDRTQDLQNATALGAYAQVQKNNTIVLGSVDNATQVVVGATVPVGTNSFGVSPVDLNSTTVTASQTSGSGTITASAAIFSASNVGEELVWADGTIETITGYTSSTVVTGSSTTITESNSYFRAHHIGFQVTNTGNAYIQNTSTTAFQVQNANAYSVFNVNTSNNTVNIGTGVVDTTPAVAQLNVTSNWTDTSGDMAIINFGEGAATNLNSGQLRYDGLSNRTSLGALNNSGVFNSVLSFGYNTEGVKLENRGSTAGAGMSIINYNSAAGIVVKPGPGADRTDAFQIQNASGVSLLNVDTSGSNIQLNANTTLGASSANRVTFNAQILGGSLVFQGATDDAYTTTFNISDPTANRTITLPNNSGVITLNTSGSAVGGTSAFVQGGQTWGTAANLGTNDANALNFLTNGTTRFTIDASGNGTLTGNLTVNGTGTSSFAGNLQSSTLKAGSSQQFQVDTSGNVTTTGTAKVQTATNSTTAFQVQNASANPAFVVDTSTSRNMVSNSGFETTPYTSGWAGTNASLGSVAGNGVYEGNRSLLVNVTTAGGGAQLTGFTTTLTPNNYNFSFEAQNYNNSGTLGVTVTGGSATCTLSATTMSTVGYQRYNCSISSSGTNITAITITSTGTGQFYLDAVQLSIGSGVQQYNGAGAIQLLGLVDSPVTIQPQGNSTTAFQIQNSAGSSNLFVADTMDNRIGIGTAAPAYLLDVQGGDINTGGYYRQGGYIVLNTNLSANNTFVGPLAGNATMTGTFNTATGTYALQQDTTGSYNIATGFNALGSNSTGSYNSAYGQWALLYNTGGSNNDAFGSQALWQNSTGNGNTGAGDSALITNTTGSYNTGLGYHSNVGAANLQNASALGAYAYVAQSNSVVLGCVAGTNGCPTTTNVGIGNTAPAGLFSVGSSSQYQVDINGNFSTTGTGLVKTTSANALQVQNGSGTQVLNVNSSSSSVQIQAASSSASTGANMFTSSYTLTAPGMPSPPVWVVSGTGSSTTATSTNTGGMGGPPSCTTPNLPIVPGYVYNITFTVSTTTGDGVAPSVGGVMGTYIYTSGTYTQSITAASTTTVCFNGDANWFGNSTNKISNISITQTTPVISTVSLLDSTGTSAVEIRGGSTASKLDTFVGLGSGGQNTSGYDNSGYGYGALQQNTSATDNTAVGAFALQNTTTGFANTSIGSGALRANTTGQWNVAVGVGALATNTTGSGNMALGDGADVASGNLQNATAIGDGAIVGQSNAVVLGGTGTLAVNVGIGTSTPSAPLDVVGAVQTTVNSANATIRIDDLSGSSQDQIAIGVAGTTKATIRVDSTGNLVMSGTGTGKLYLNYDAGTGGVQIGQSTYKNNLTVYGTAATCTLGNSTAGDSCTSDARLKTNVVDLTNSLNNVMALRPVTFTWKDPTYPQGTNMGFIAQEVQQIFPESVSLNESSGYYQLDYASLVVPAIGAIQQQQGEISGLTSQVLGMNTSVNTGSVQTGSLGVSGGTTLQGTTNVQANLNVTGATTLSSLVVNGGAGISGNLNVGGNFAASSLNVNVAVVSGSLSVAGLTTVHDIVVGGHLMSQGSTPTVALGSAAGKDGQVTIDGTDTAGTITVTVKAHQPTAQELQQGVLPEVLTQGDLADVTFSQPFQYTPRVVISPDNQDSIGLPVYITKDQNGYHLVITKAAQSGKTYQFDYVIIASGNN